MSPVSAPKSMILNSESLPDVQYNEPHTVKKYMPTIEENFDNPFLKPNRFDYEDNDEDDDTSYNNYGSRFKRQIKKDTNAYWGIHQLSSTGILQWSY